MVTKFAMVLLLGGAVAASALVAVASHRSNSTNVDGVEWLDSFKDARALAKKTHRPILFLSMFGHLDEDMPCANARTLRATLFKDPEFKKLVSTEVIPAWEMVRQVPKVQIDLGDGKKVVRTVRGNAVLYLCNSQGRVVDAFPGVYSKEDFMPMLRESLSKLADADTKTVLAYHAERGHEVIPALITMGKCVMESPTLELMGAAPNPGFVSEKTDADPKRQRFLQAAKGLRDMSLTPMTPEETIFASTGKDVHTQDPKVLAAEVLRRDSDKNMRSVRPVVHLYFASCHELPTPEEARDNILENILKIPYKDPYFGLKEVLMPGTPS